MSAPTGAVPCLAAPALVHHARCTCLGDRSDPPHFPAVPLPRRPA